jgi:hypothetical protein
MMEAARTSETSVDNHFTRQYNAEDSSEHHTRRRENLKSHIKTYCSILDIKAFNNFLNKKRLKHVFLKQIFWLPLPHTRKKKPF